jgi:TRAP transporter TAXI family solute receptor
MRAFEAQLQAFMVWQLRAAYIYWITNKEADNMMKLKSAFTASVLAAGVMLAGAVQNVSAAEPTYVTIGTGGQTGVYYVVGQSICRLVNRGADDHGIKCTAPSTGGSVANLNAIREGGQDMGVAQSDMQFHAYNGTDKFAEQGANPELRAVFSVHPEPFTVVARSDSGIKVFDDLKGKRVNVGNPGSGQRGTMEVLMERKGWTLDDFMLASELKSSEQSQALCDNKVDAIIFTVGHPNGSIKEATTSCDAIMVPVEGAEVDALVSENDYYAGGGGGDGGTGRLSDDAGARIGGTAGAAGTRGATGSGGAGGGGGAVAPDDEDAPPTTDDPDGDGNGDGAGDLGDSGTGGAVEDRVAGGGGGGGAGGRAGEPGTGGGGGGGAVGLWAIDVRRVVIIESLLAGGPGGLGADGVAGAGGQPGSSGGNGAVPNADDELLGVGGGGGGGGSGGAGGRGGGGAGGPSIGLLTVGVEAVQVEASTVRGGAGGAGAAGGAAGRDGTDGADGDATFGGSGGAEGGGAAGSSSGTDGIGAAGGASVGWFDAGAAALEGDASAFEGGVGGPGGPGSTPGPSGNVVAKIP